ncbi:MAG TPA: BamA/TamA family outer membrane protein [Chthoniobacterales bacterium]
MNARRIFQLLAWMAALPLLAADRVAAPTPSTPSTAAAKATPTPGPVSGFEVRFQGVKSISETELREASAEMIELSGRTGLTAPRADDAAFYVELFYRRHGYISSVVNWHILEGGRILELDVNEGPLTNLGPITYQGNDHYSDTLLNDFLVGTTRERFSTFKKKLPFVEQDIETGIGKITSFYQSEGYLDVKVLPWPVEYTADLSLAKPGITIVEGLRYWFGHISISGATPAQDKEWRAQISHTIKFPYTEMRRDTLQNELQAYLKSQGYFTANVTITPTHFDIVRGLVDVAIAVEPGKVYHFDGVTVSGTQKLRPEIIPERFRFLSGRTYDSSLLDSVYRDVVATGLFSEFRIHETPIGDNKIRLDISVVEAKSKEFGLYAGVGSYEGPFVGTTFQDRNVFGYGRPVTMSIEWSARGFTGGIEFLNPWFMGRKNELKLSLFSRALDNEGYSVTDFGLRLDMTRKFNRHFKAGVFGQIKTSKITSKDIDPLLLGPTDYQSLSFGVAASVDFRNNALAPGRGWVFDAAIGYAQFGGFSGGLKPSFRLSYYLPIRQSLLAFGVRSAALLTSGDVTDVPIDERYFSGGGTTVRSFKERELGPLFRDRFPLGGLQRTIFNVEYQYPIIKDLKAAVFVDAGNLLQDNAFFSTDDMSYAIGLGIRYNLPVGPLRLDYGFNPSPREGESRGAFHFSFGFAF